MMKTKTPLERLEQASGALEKIGQLIGAQCSNPNDPNLIKRVERLFRPPQSGARARVLRRCQHISQPVAHLMLGKYVHMDNRKP